MSTAAALPTTSIAAAPAAFTSYAHPVAMPAATTYTHPVTYAHPTTGAYTNAATYAHPTVGAYTNAATYAHPTVGAYTNSATYAHPTVGAYTNAATYAQPTHAQPMTYTYAPGAYTQPVVAGFTSQQVGAALDTNHDGKVSQEELAEADTNHDGKVSASEVQQLIHPVSTYTHPATYAQPIVHSQPMTYTYAPGAYTQPIIAGFTAQQVGGALDTNHDGKVSQEELAKADTNHDGTVSASEVQQLVQPAHTVTYSQPVQTAGSFVAYPQYSYAPGAYAQPVVPYGFTAQQVGAALDTDNDGKISQEELKAADSNKDGKVDAAEIAAKQDPKKKDSKKKKTGCC